MSDRETIDFLATVPFLEGGDEADLAELAQISEAYSGSEIEQAVISGLHFAFAESVELQQKHLVRAVQETIPLATTMGEDIARQREWAKTRARPASGRVKPPKVA